MSKQPTNGEVYHHMSYQEREDLKRFARQCASNGDIASMESTLIMIAHFMRQRVDVPFQEYASQWCAARNNDRLIATTAMRTQWPAPLERHIDDGGTDYQGRGWVCVTVEQRSTVRMQLAEWIANNPYLTFDDMLVRGVSREPGLDRLSINEIESHLRAMVSSDEWPIHHTKARIVRATPHLKRGYSSRLVRVYVHENDKNAIRGGCNVDGLRYASVADAKSTLERYLPSNPRRVLQDAQDCLAYPYCPNSHRSMFQTMLSKAIKVLKDRGELI